MKYSSKQPLYSPRPLVHSILGDLIGHIRSELNQDQISRIIDCYCCHLQDSSLSPACISFFLFLVLTVCSKLLFNVSDSVATLKDKTEGRRMLLKILESYSFKIESLYEYVPYLTSHVKNKSTVPSQETTLDSFYDLEYAQPIKVSSKPWELSQDVVKGNETSDA